MMIAQRSLLRWCFAWQGATMRVKEATVAASTSSLMKYNCEVLYQLYPTVHLPFWNFEEAEHLSVIQNRYHLSQICNKDHPGWAWMIPTHEKPCFFVCIYRDPLKGGDLGFSMIFPASPRLAGIRNHDLRWRKLGCWAPGTWDVFFQKASSMKI